jgi:multidrug efflux system membrane fusion protein
VRGQTKAKATVVAAAETTGTVKSIEVSNGQQVKAGTLLCTLDPETRQAAVAQAQASMQQAQAGVDKAQADYDTNEQLIKRNVASANSQRQLEVALEGAKATLAGAKVALDNAKMELNRTNIYAKVDGVIEDVANVGQLLSSVSPAAAVCANIVELNPIVFTGAVPEANIGYARDGLPVTVKTVTGKTLKGKVTYIAAVADAATRTFPVEVDLDNPGYAVRAGVTAEGVVDVGATPAQLLPQSALTLDDQGTIGVRAVQDSKVVFYPITILKDAREGMYVSGLPPKVDVITVGQEFVKAGDTVKAVPDTGTSSVGPTAGSQGANS